MGNGSHYNLIKRAVWVKETTAKQFSAINSWVSNLWQHHGSNQPEKNDPIYILEQVKKGERYRCVEYSIAVSGCLNADGIPSRILAFKDA